MPSPRKRPANGKHTPPFLTVLIRRIAKRMGATVILEPEFGYVGQILFANGRRTFFRNRVLSINTVSAVEVSRDKNYSAFFLKKFGYRVPKEQTFFSKARCEALGSERGVEAACDFAQKLGFPVIVKPNDLSQGTMVTKALNRSDVRKAAREITERCHVFLVQQFIPGRDYRIVVLDDQVISAYERSPLAVKGDGKRTIRQLLVQKQKSFERDGRDTCIDFEDVRMHRKLASQKLTLASVLPSGKEMNLLDNANLSTGGESRDVTHEMHDDYRRLAIAVTKDMGLRLCGVDLLTSDITQPKDASTVILEINGAPGLDHYAATGKAQQKIVEDLYARVLRAIESQ
jgi:D-alanine-D-alanine ligase-like ATP-grasp enzyme